MARANGIENIEKDLTGNLESDLNQLVRAILVDCLLYTSDAADE